MFGVGWTEMLLVGIVALVVIGPKDLPVVMSRLGKAVAQIRRLGSEFQREINKTTGLDQITDLRRAVTEPLKQTAAEITREFNKATTTGTEPSGAIAPKVSGSESVVDEIREKVGMSPAQPVLPMVPPMLQTPAAPQPLESPAPAEAIAPVEAKAAPKPRKPRAKKVATVAAAAAPQVPEAVAETPAPAEALPPKKPRARRTPKPTAES